MNKCMTPEEFLHAMCVIPPSTDTSAHSAANYASELGKLSAELDKYKLSLGALGCTGRPN